MFSIKPGVRLQGIQPEVIIALLIADEVYREHQIPLVVTSGQEGPHRDGSLHHQGLAVDLRCPESIRREVAKTLQARLGEEFDVIAEATHIHIEFDPPAY